MGKVIALSVLFLFISGCAGWQTAENRNSGGKLKTIFLHIEGFTKSISGAI